MSNRLFEIFVRRGNYPDVYLNRARAAHALELVLLQHAQQFDLQRGRELADLIEKNCAAVGNFQPAFLLHQCSGERAFLMTEQFAFQ